MTSNSSRIIGTCIKFHILIEFWRSKWLFGHANRIFRKRNDYQRANWILMKRFYFLRHYIGVTVHTLELGTSWQVALSFAHEHRCRLLEQGGFVDSVVHQKKIILSMNVDRWNGNVNNKFNCTLKQFPVEYLWLSQIILVKQAYNLSYLLI